MLSSEATRAAWAATAAAASTAASSSQVGVRVPAILHSSRAISTFRSGSYSLLVTPGNRVG